MDEALKSTIIDAVVAMAQAQSVALYPTEKYGGTVFLTDPDKQGSFVAGVFAYGDHVSVEFSQGADFEDLDNVLEGKGKARRHVKLTTLADIQGKTVEGFLKQALK